MKCKCGSQFLPLDEEQKKCITCLVSEGCKKTGRKCWNDEPEMEIKNYSYVKNENYMFLRSDVKPTYYYWVTPERFFELYKILNNSKRLGNLYLPSQMREG